MAHPIEVEVVAVDHKVYAGQAMSVTAPGADGYFGILSGHAPLVAALGVGMITIMPSGETSPIYIAVAGGFAEVAQDHVTILAETAEMANEIDVARAREAADRARERLAHAEEGVDADRAKAALLRAINRLHTAAERHIG